MSAEPRSRGHRTLRVWAVLMTIVAIAAAREAAFARNRVQRPSTTPEPAPSPSPSPHSA